ncbi:MAG: T9SS type A sorting domain-containing protein, partial [Chitinophaga rupis]
HFTIQRSSDGVNFNPIGTVTAKGNSSSVSSYSFTDANPNLQGYNYYRLAETDLDGKTNFSLVRVVNFGNGKAVSVQTSPNPVRDMLNIVVSEDNITILLNDMSGKVIRTLRLAQGFHQTSLSDLPGGVYQLTIIQGQNKIDSRQIRRL